MKNKLVVVADLGHLKAYKVEYDELNGRPKFAMIENLSTSEADGRLSDKVTDDAGSFAGGQRGYHEARSTGDRHNIELEFARRAVGKLADTINQIVKNDYLDTPVYFAAVKEISNQLLRQLSPAVRARIEKIVPEDLVKVHQTELLAHF